MVISIEPIDRSDFREFSRLKIKYERGSLETPNRFVTMVDLNAKDGIGANIPLTRLRKLFLLEEKINFTTLLSIKETNGYLSTFVNRVSKKTNYTSTSGSMKVFYPSLTDDLRHSLKSGTMSYFECFNFLVSATNVLNFDYLLLDEIFVTSETKQLLSSIRTQYSPVVDIREKRQVHKKLNLALSIPPIESPFLAIRFASYLSANKAYDYLNLRLDKIHESKRAVLSVGSPRPLSYEESLDISAPHYGPMIVSDLIAERSYNHPGPKNDIRLFNPNDLSLPKISEMSAQERNANSGFKFNNDIKLNELFERLRNNDLLPAGLDNRRGKYLSRVHENVVSNTEFGFMRGSIKSNEIREYIMSKRLMTKVLKKHIKNYFS
jgi:hypothetical protein